MKQKLKVKTPITRSMSTYTVSWPQTPKVTFNLGISTLWLISLSRFKTVSSI